MAIEFARSSILTRSAGHTAIKAAAYRAGEKLIDERIGRVANYAHRADEVGHSEILLPAGAAESLRDRTTLWGAVEAREDEHNRRMSAQLAIDAVIALPVELSKAQHIELARTFAEQEFVSKGLVVDLAIHYHSDGNPHAHLMRTTRVLEGDRFGAKYREGNGKFYGGKKIAEVEQLRHRWAEFQNAYFRENGIDALVMNNDGQYRAEVHLGPAHAMEDKGIKTVRQEQRDAAISARDAALLAHPEMVIERVSDRKSVFTRHDLYRELNELCASADVYAQVKTMLDASSLLIKIKADGQEFLTTQRVLETEMVIRGKSEILGRASEIFAVGEKAVQDFVIARTDLSDEQKDGAKALLDGRRLGVVVGLAGAGKSTMLRSVKEAYESQGHRVVGVTLGGKAAMELSASSGIESRTITSWLWEVEKTHDSLKAGDVVVMDEAGMVNNVLMDRVLAQVVGAGAKLVLIGDGEQLQPIQAGCPFRDIAMQQGFTEIGTVRRQKVAWQREATENLARGRGVLAVSAYEAAGHVHHFAESSDAFDQLVSDYLAVDEGSKIVLAHRNKDVWQINEQIRAGLVESGAVQAGVVFGREDAKETPVRTPFGLTAGDRIRFGSDDSVYGVKAGDEGIYLGRAGDEHRVRTVSGDEFQIANEDYEPILPDEVPEVVKGAFGAGDRILFTRNDRSLKVSNGSLGTVQSHIEGVMSVVLDGQSEPVRFTHDEYSDVAHGYAATVHKSQGMTVDRSFVLASATMDKHLGYVSLSRHRERTDVYVSNELMFGKSLGEVVSRVRRQETALELAERHGLELDTATVEPLNFAPIVTRAGVTEPSAEVPAIAEAVPMRMGMEEAQRLLDAERDRLLSEQNREHVREQGALRAIAEASRRALEAHENTHPGRVLFGGKAREAQWQETRKSLQVEHHNDQQAIKRLDSTYRDGREYREYSASKGAAERLPQAASVLSIGKARDNANALVGRWQSLESTLTGLGVNADSLDAQRVRTDLHQVLQQIARAPSAVKSAMSAPERAALDAALARSEKSMERAQARDRSLGR